MYVSIDVGGTSTRIALSNSLNIIDLSRKSSWNNTHTFETDYQKLVDEIKKQDKKVEANEIHA